ncbi:MAG: AMP-dependent synthetase [Hyphomicrobiales bacterium]|nr:AMP-dependent synthetase [Hyphomicrobiales bacterium]
MLLPDARDYASLVRDFVWRVPARFNIGAACCDGWAAREPGRPAVLDATGGGLRVTTFADLKDRSDRLANALRARGVRRGDRVAILLPQSADVAASHLAVYKLGAVALPLAALFGVDALEYRLNDAGVAALITDAAGVAKVAGVRAALPDLRFVASIDGADGGALDFQRMIADADPAFACVDTSADDPAMMIYTSGTTGPPKGALHAHRVLPGHLPGVQFPHDHLPQPGDLMWTPADWAWAGGLLNVLLPALYFGLPVVAYRAPRFDAEAAFGLMERMAIRNAFVPPTALRMLRSVERPAGRYKLALRTLASGGESLGAQVWEWGRAELGLAINEFYGQTECNLVLASCADAGVSRPGAIGKAVPGHTVAVIRPDGRACAPGEPGQIAIARPDPVMFLEYWRQPEATARKFIGDWMTTGDQGHVDEDGYVFFVGRDDDVITSSGYRIGPTEIEDCLLRHPAVAIAAVVGQPDALRTEIVRAFLVLKPGVQASQELASEIQGFVRTRLSAHEYPRRIDFVDELPMTTTGKIIRRLLRDRP